MLTWPDDLSPRLVKELKQQIFMPLAAICNLKLQQNTNYRNIYKKWAEFLENNNNLSDAQHGFRNKCSPLTSWTTSKVSYENWDDQIPSVIVHLDFQKAFDKVPHERLKKKKKTWVGRIMRQSDFLDKRLAHLEENGDLYSTDRPLRGSRSQVEWHSGQGWEPYSP